MYLRLRKVAPLHVIGYKKGKIKIIDVPDIDANRLALSLFNARCLRRHTLDIKDTKYLTGNDILYLIESQMSIDRLSQI